jgi:hypothetical protein
MTVSRYENHESVNLILLMEPNERLAEVALALRRAFPSAKLVGLFDSFHPEQEVALRTTGAIFLGSCERFLQNAQSILSKALRLDCDGQAGNDLEALQAGGNARKNMK